MAYIYKPQFDSLDEEQKKLKSEAPSDLAAGSSAVGANAQALNSPEQTGTSGYTDVAKYLDANKDQSIQMGKTIGDKLAGEGEALKTGINTSADTTRKTIDYNTARQEKDRYGNQITKNVLDSADFYSKNDLKSLQQNNNLAENKQYESADNYFNPNYGGPNSWNDTGEYSKYKNDLDEYSKKIAPVTNFDKKALLEGIGTNRTAGMYNLDNLLFTQTPEIETTIKNSVQPYADLGIYLDSTNSEIQQNIDNAKKVNDTVKAERAKEAQDYINNFQGGIDTRVNTARSDATTKTNQAKDVLKNFNNYSWIHDGTKYSPDDTLDMWNGINNSNVWRLNSLKNEIGMTPQEYGELARINEILAKAGTINFTPENLNYGVGKSIKNNEFVNYPGSDPLYGYTNDIQKYATYLDPNLEITRSNVATPQEYAKVRALESLLKNDYGSVLDQDVSDAGTAKKDLVNFDTNKALTESRSKLSDKDKYFESVIKGLKETPEYLKAIARNKAPSQSKELTEYQRDAIRAGIRLGLIKLSDLPTDHNLEWY